MRLTLVLALLGLTPTLAPGGPTVRVLVEPRPGLTFARQAPSTLTLGTPWGTQTVRLSGAAAYPADPEHYWSALNPVTIRLRTPPHLAAGRYPVSAKTEFYVCAQALHLCTVRRAETRGELTTGPGAVPLRLTLKVPGPSAPGLSTPSLRKC